MAGLGLKEHMMQTNRIRRSLVAGTLAVGMVAVAAPLAQAEILTTDTSLTTTTTSVTTSTGDGSRVMTSYENQRWDEGSTSPHTSLDVVNTTIGATMQHRRGVDGTGVGVALIDSGVVGVDDLMRPGAVVNGPDLSFESQAPDLLHLDTFGHGTHLGGIIAANGANAVGVAPDAHLVSLKVAAHDGATDVSQVIAAIDWVVQHRNDPGMNIRVLNLAYGTDGVQDRMIDPLAYAVEVAWRHGIVVVVSAGNDGAGARVTNPAISPFVITVGATDPRATGSVSDDVLADFTSTGDGSRGVDVVAPGKSIASLRNPGSRIDEEHPSARVGEHLFRGSGSSQAAAVVSGAVAVLLEARPELTPDEVKALLMATGHPVAGTAARSVDVHLAASQRVPANATQRHKFGAGTGSLEAARGTSHVADGDVELIGEQDIFGMPWYGEIWAPMSLAGKTWYGGTWMGRELAGDCWCSESWSGRSWTGRSWTGSSWTGRSWTGRSWTARSWTGRSWTGETWTGRSWTGRSWTGRSWTTSAGESGSWTSRSWS